MRLADPLDQASGLRRLFAPEPAFQSLGVLGPDARRTARACAAIGLSMGRRGHRVMVMDETRAPHNVAGLLGILPRYSLADAPSRGLVSVVQQAPDGLVLLAAQDGLNILAGLSEHNLLDMAEAWQVRADRPEWLMLNGGDGPLRCHGLAATASLRVLVIPGNRAALADAYAVMKSVHTAWSGNNWLVLVDGAEEGQALGLFTSLSETAQRFLGVTPSFLGCIARETPGTQPAVLDAVLVDSLSEAGSRQTETERINFEQYWQRMWLYSRTTAEAATKKVQNGWRNAG
ncbi:MAG: hypothetical protein B7Y41_04210 [Hydrogenophilales bacterium 28-61-23]|nr:MAG: hypothetical protein B7Y41_04210 [Hydrogenophilales bacterium 28-61-23]